MRVVAAVAAIILGVIGLLISSCGLLFLGAVGDGGMWPIAMICVISGGLLIWGAIALWRSLRKSAPAATAGSRPDDAPPAQ